VVEIANISSASAAACCSASQRYLSDGAGDDVQHPDTVSFWSVGVDKKKETPQNPEMAESS
jgi:hypothetical protein